MEYQTITQIIDIYQKHNKFIKKNEDLFYALVEMYELGYEQGKSDTNQNPPTNKINKREILDRFENLHKDELNIQNLTTIFKSFATKINNIFVENDNGCAIFSKKHLKRYNSSYGDILTAQYKDEKTIELIFQTNYIDKNIPRKLSAKYNFVSAKPYEEAFMEPTWIITFKLKTEQELQLFLKDFEFLFSSSSLKYNSCDFDKEPTFLFSLENIKKEKKTLVHFMEKEDWTFFKTFIYEFYHDERIDFIEEAVDLCELEVIEPHGFSSSLSKEEIKEKLESLPNFEYLETTQLSNPN